MVQDLKTLSLSTIAECVGLIVAVAFVVSVIYDWGFVFALGLDFSYLPTTTADTFHTGLLWFPRLLGLVFAYFVIEFQLQRVERGYTEQEIIQLSNNPERIRRFRESPYKAFAWLATLACFTWILCGDLITSVQPLCVAIVWFIFAKWCYSSPLIKMRRRIGVHRAFTLLPIIGSIAFFTGYNAAVDAAIRKPFDITIERQTPLVAVSGHLLRIFERGLLLVEDKQVISFVPWEQISAIHENTAYKPFRGVLCEWLNFCPQPADEQPSRHPGNDVYRAIKIT
ncbi:MAG: hypothetical protein U1E66_08545 [Rhodospirillales bacterium]